MDKKQQLKVCSFNAKGLGEIKKRRKTFNFLKQLSYDVILLQETHSTLEEESLWKKQWNV